MSHAYWVVGAMWGGHDDQLATYLRRGYWQCRKLSDREVAALADFKPGDRIAVKRMLGRPQGQGSPDIEIRALGVVTEIEPEERGARVYVRWLVDGLARVVPSKGCFATIHGPFPADDEWTKAVFQI